MSAQKVSLDTVMVRMQQMFSISEVLKTITEYTIMNPPNPVSTRDKAPEYCPLPLLCDLNNVACVADVGRHNDILLTGTFIRDRWVGETKPSLS